jgi:tRNA threonylcarbamoyl adenosine modification protein YeaZ
VVIKETDCILAMESSEKRASMVISVMGQDKEFILEPGKEQSTELVPLLQKVLSDAGIDADKISDIAIHTGPGSATGLRMGIAMVQAIALVYPNIHIHSIPLEAMTKATLDELGELEVEKAMLLSNAYGGTVFVQEYTYNNGWQDEGDISIMSHSEAQKLDSKRLVLSDIGNLKNKVEWPENWKWYEEGFIDAATVFKALKQENDFKCDIEKLDVRYLKATSAELNWKK